MIPALERYSSEHDDPHLLIEMKEFRGWENTDAFWEDLKLDAEYIGEFTVGCSSDRLPSGPEILFLPDLVKKGFADARIQRADTSLHYVAGQTIYSPPNPADINAALASPALVFWFLLVGTLFTGFFYRENRTFWLWYDRILFGCIGLVGLLILFLCVYPSTSWNWNILWSAPALAAFILSFIDHKIVSGSYKKFGIIYAALLFIFLLSWPIIPQQLSSSILPLFLLLGFRNIISGTLNR